MSGRWNCKKESKERLGDVLVQSGIITEQQLIEALKIQLGVEFVDLTAVSIPVELAKYVPRTLAKKYCVVPVKLVRDTLYLAMSDPLDFIAQEEVKAASRKRVIPMIATHRATEQAISRLYGSEGHRPRHRRDEARGRRRRTGYRARAAREGQRRQRGRARPSALSTPSSSAPLPSARAISISSRRRARWWCVCASTACSAAF